MERKFHSGIVGKDWQDKNVRLIAHGFEEINAEETGKRLNKYDFYGVIKSYTIGDLLCGRDFIVTEIYFDQDHETYFIVAEEVESDVATQFSIDIRMPRNGSVVNAEKLLAEIEALIEGNAGYTVLGSSINDMTEQYRKMGVL